MTYEQYIAKLCLLLEQKGFKKDVIKKMPDKKLEFLAQNENVLPTTDFTSWCLKFYGYAFAWKGARNGYILDKN